MYSSAARVTAGGALKLSARAIPVPAKSTTARRRAELMAITDALGVARSNLAIQATLNRSPQRRGRRPLPDAVLLSEIKDIIAGLPTYGYRRVYALLRRRRE
jgi:hypothetical protein